MILAKYKNGNTSKVEFILGQAPIGMPVQKLPESLTLYSPSLLGVLSKFMALSIICVLMILLQS